MSQAINCSTIRRRNGHQRRKYPQIIAGCRYGQLTAIEPAARHPNGRVQWRLHCDCGREIVAIASNVECGNTTSCGAQGGIHRARHFKHGHAVKGQESSEFVIWMGMLSRCGNPKGDAFLRYGGRGITICERWRESFENFLADMGPRPSPLHSVDRIDNGGNYEPNNCRWATPSVQGRNRRNNHIVEFRGQKMCLTEAAEMFGKTFEIVHKRLHRGWSVERALTAAPRVTKRRKCLAELGTGATGS